MSQVKQKWIDEQMEKAENDVEEMRAVILQFRAVLLDVGWHTRESQAAMKASEPYVEEAESAGMKLLGDVVTVTPGGRGCGSWLSVGTTSVAMRSEEADDLKRDIGRAIAEAVNDALRAKDA